MGRAQEGDVDAFEMLLRHYQTPLYRLAHRLVNDRGEAEDIVQDTFIQAWRRLPSLTELEAFRSWIYQITTRRCLDLLRTRSRRRTDATDSDRMTDVASTDATTDPAAAATYQAHLRGLADHLGRLPDDQRACWVLRELHELSYHEIAFAMRLPVSTVRGRIARARQNLMRGMESWR